MASIETNSKVGLISKALILCGEAPLNSLSDDRYGSQVGGNLFDLVYENELQSNPWRFATKKTSLSRLNLTPVNQYTYAYQIPTDCLLPLFVYPRSAYEIYGTRVYTDQTAVDLDYLFKPEVSALPAYFSALMVYALARDMINPITASLSAVEAMQRKYVLQRQRAQYADAQSRPSKSIQDSPFTDVRGAR